MSAEESDADPERGSNNRPTSLIKQTSDQNPNDACPKDFVQHYNICYNWKDIHTERRTMSFSQARESRTFSKS